MIALECVFDAVPAFSVAYPLKSLALPPTLPEGVSEWRLFGNHSWHLIPLVTSFG